MSAREKEHINQKKETITVPIPEKPEPIHQNFVTFTSTEKKWRGKGKNKKITRPVKQSEKEPFFGKALKYPRTDDEILKDRLKTYNEGTQGIWKYFRFLRERKLLLSFNFSNLCFIYLLIAALYFKFFV